MTLTLLNQYKHDLTSMSLYLVCYDFSLALLLITQKHPNTSLIEGLCINVDGLLYHNQLQQASTLIMEHMLT
jgi:hypothetical protein